MYTIEEFDNAKTKVLKYILYKKRSEQEVKQNNKTTRQKQNSKTTRQKQKQTKQKKTKQRQKKQTEKTRQRTGKNSPI